MSGDTCSCLTRSSEFPPCGRTVAPPFLSPVPVRKQTQTLQRARGHLFFDLILLSDSFSGAPPHLPLVLLSTNECLYTLHDGLFVRVYSRLCVSELGWWVL